MNKSSLTQVFAVSVFLAGCAASPPIAPNNEHDHSHGAASAAKPVQGEKEAKDGRKDMKAMCDMHKEMMSKSPAEREAMMAEKMKRASADGNRTKMMDEHCK
jgi:hypothetical protein